MSLEPRFRRKAYTLFGTPKVVQFIDEWALSLACRIESGRYVAESISPVESYSLGENKTPLCYERAVGTFTTLLRPAVFGVLHNRMPRDGLFFLLNLKIVSHRRTLFPAHGVCLIMISTWRCSALCGYFFPAHTGLYSDPWQELIGCFALYTAALVCMFLPQT